jgi:hypothetical protein
MARDFRRCRREPTIFKRQETVARGKKLSIAARRTLIRKGLQVVQELQWDRL